MSKYIPDVLYPYQINGFIQNKLDKNWSHEQICSEFRDYLRKEHGFNNEAQLQVTFTDNDILHWVGIL